jgi:hypothetical protein
MDTCGTPLNPPEMLEIVHQFIEYTDTVPSTKYINAKNTPMLV